jgi:Skp family chaperone for outer membrane proteins
MRWFVVFATLTLFTTGGVAERRVSPSIGYINIQQIAAQTPDAKAAAGKVESLRRERASQLAEKQKEIEDVHAQWANAGSVFKSAERQQLQQKEDRLRADFQTLSRQAQTDIQSLERQIQSEERAKISAIVDDIAKRRGLDIVLNQDTAVIWAPPGGDLTAEVISRMNGSK